MHKGYLKFINKRDEVLQNILNKQTGHITNITARCFLDVIDIISTGFIHINDKNRFTTKGRQVIYMLNYHIAARIQDCVKELLDLIQKYKRIGKTLTYASELEALARVQDKKLKARGREHKINREELGERLLLAFNKLKTELALDIDKAYVQKKDAEWIVTRFKDNLPTKRQLPDALPKLPNRQHKEANRPFKQFTFDQISDADWEEILDAYKEEFIPEYRYARDADGELYKYGDDYAWEVEQQSTYEYLQAIKDGKIEACKEAGVSDLLWIAVRDDRTRPEHADKDGHTSSEIEEKLQDEWSDFEDQETVAPSGFNCRCRSVPYTPDADIQTEDLFDEGDWESWLNN